MCMLCNNGIYQNKLIDRDDRRDDICEFVDRFKPSGLWVNRAIHRAWVFCVCDAGKHAQGAIQGTIAGLVGEHVGKRNYKSMEF